MHLPQNKSDRMAVFVDIENVAGYCDLFNHAIDITPVITELSLIAKPILFRSFGDIFSLPQHFNKHKVRRMLQQNHIPHEDVPHLSGSKNSADIRLTVEAMSIAYLRPEITHYAIFSNDRDFIPLFSHLREMGKVVIGCGPAKHMVNEDYHGACDHFIHHDEVINALTPVESVSSNLSIETQSTITDIDRLILAINAVNAEGQASLSSFVAAKMRCLFPDFDIKQLYGTFKRFCIEQQKSGLIQLLYIDQPHFQIINVNSSNSTNPNEFKSMAVIPDLTELYRQWAIKKLKIDMPSLATRLNLYRSMVQILDSHCNSHPISLKMLSRQTGQSSPEAENVAFRVLYGLYRSHALQSLTTDDNYNPNITGINIPVEQLDSYFTGNTLNTFHKDESGLPFDADAWGLLVRQ